jgi:WD40 repeat protein
MRCAGLLLLLLAAPVPAQSFLLPRFDDRGWPLPAGAVASVGPARLRHPGPIEGIALSPDGKLVGCIGCDGVVVVYDAATAHVRFRADLPGSADAENLGQCHIAFGPRRGQLAVMASGELRVFDLDTGRAELKLGITDDDQWSALSPDGRVAVVGSKKSCWQIDVATGAIVREISIRGPGPVWAEIHATNLMVVAKNRVQFFDLATGAYRGDLPKARENEDISVAPSSDELIVARLYSDRRPSVTFENIGEGRGWLGSPAVDGPCYTAFSPDGRTLAVAFPAGPVLLDVRTGEAIRTMHGRARVCTMAFSADGRTLAGVTLTHTSGRDVILWDVATGRRRTAADDSVEFPKRLRFRDDGRLLVFGPGAEEHDWRRGRLVRREPPGRFLGAVLDVALDGGQIAVSDDEDRIQLLDAVGRVSGDVPGPRWHAHHHAVFSLDGGRLYSVVAEGSVCAWDVAGGARLFEFLRERAGATLAWNERSLALSPDGRTLAAVTAPLDDKPVLRFWDARDGRVHRDCPLEEMFDVFRLSFSADGRLVALIAHNEPSCRQPEFNRLEQPDVRVWDWAAGTPARLLHGVPRGKRCLALSPDGRMAAVGCKDGRVWVWEVATGAVRAQFAGHHGEVTSVAFSPNGRYLASASDESPVYVWDLLGPLPGLDLARLLLDLADPSRALTAMRRLIGSPNEAIATLRQQLPPVAAVSESRLDELVTSLDDARPGVRAKALADLRRVADQAPAWLAARAAAATSPEARRQLRQLLEKMDGPSPDLAVRLRALEAMERIGTPAARALVAEWAAGAPAARFTREAAAALARMK